MYVMILFPSSSLLFLHQISVQRREALETIFDTDENDGESCTTAHVVALVAAPNGTGPNELTGIAGDADENPPPKLNFVRASMETVGCMAPKATPNTERAGGASHTEPKQLEIGGSEENLVPKLDPKPVPKRNPSGVGGASLTSLRTSERKAQAVIWGERVKSFISPSVRISAI